MFFEEDGVGSEGGGVCSLKVGVFAHVGIFRAELPYISLPHAPSIKETHCFGMDLQLGPKNEHPLERTGDKI